MSSVCRVGSHLGFYCQNFQAGCDINKTNEPRGCMHSVISSLWFKFIIIIIKKCRSFFAQVHILQQFSLLRQQTKTLPHERGCGRGALSGTLHNFVCFCRRQYSKLSTQKITFVPHENLMVILGAGVVMALYQLLLDVAKELLIACTWKRCVRMGWDVASHSGENMHVVTQLTKGSKQERWLLLAMLCLSRVDGWALLQSLAEIQMLNLNICILCKWGLAANILTNRFSL